MTFKFAPGQPENFRAKAVANAVELGNRLVDEWATAPGFHRGHVWATQYAIQPELVRLARAWKSAQPNAEYVLLNGHPTDAYSAAERIACIIEGEEQGNWDRDHARAFWDAHGGAASDETLNDPDYLKGFILGALSGLDEAK